MSYLIVALSVHGPEGRAIELVAERRPNPARSQPGFLIFPVFAHIPGIGSTYGAGFLDQNFAGTRTDIFGVGSFGDTTTAIMTLRAAWKGLLVANLTGPLLALTKNTFK